MKIVIVGAGAMGTLFTAFLARTGEEVHLLDKHPERVKIIKRKGIKVSGASRLEVPGSKLQVTSKSEKIGIADLIIIFVKAYATADVAEKIRPLVGKNTSILTLQNGLNNINALIKFFGKEEIFGGTTAQGATYLGAGEVFHAGKGETIIGAMSREQRTKSEKISKIFNRAGIETKVTDNLESAIWSKLVLNSAINPLAALTRRKNGDLVKEKNLCNLLCVIALETSKVAQAKGIKLLYSNPERKVIESCQKTAENINSMLQDILQNKRTEIDFLNGAIVKEAKKVKVDAPLNQILWILVKSNAGLEKGKKLFRG